MASLRNSSETVEGAPDTGMWGKAGLSWSVFELARNPYYFLVVIYVFPAYFAGMVVGDPVKGQAVVAGSIEIAGYICAITAPMLGAVMDRGGRRKPVLAVFIGALALCGCLLWFSKGDGGGLGVAGTVAVLVIGYVTYTYSEVMHNAMLPLAGRPSSISSISGMGLSMGQLGAAIGLTVVVVLDQNPQLLGLTPGSDQIPRGVGPSTALWMIVFITPFFLFMPDGAPQNGSWVRAFKELLFGEDGYNLFGRIKVFVTYIRGLFKDYPGVMKFLVVRMIYADGVTTLLSLGGVYTAGVLGWGIAELALYGIWGSIFGVIGGFIGGSLMDKMLGPRRAIVVELILASVGVALAISVTQETILYGYVPAGHDVHGLPVFSTLAEMFYLLAIAIVAIFTTAIISSSRVMLVKIAPPERLSEFFGLYMLAATATVWMGPMLVRIATDVSQDQRIGFSPVLGMLLVGAVLMVVLVKDVGSKRA